MNWKPTKEQPGRYTWMLDAIAEKENTNTTKVIKYNSVEQARKQKIKLTDMFFNIEGKELKCHKVEIKKGGIQSLFFEGFDMPLANYTGSVYIMVRKGLSEFNSKPEYAGQYKNCEGGGWYSMANLYKFDGLYYTDAY